jgi:protoporphyrinogen IX oxidase
VPSVLYLWFKALHIIFLVTWFAGLFYLPRLFVYHVNIQDKPSKERFQIMEARLFYIIMLPSSLLTSFFALAMLVLQPAYLPQAWIHIKLSIVLLLFLYQGWLWMMMQAFAKEANRYSERFFRYYNEVPSILLIIGVLAAVFKPGGVL